MNRFIPILVAATLAAPVYAPAANACGDLDSCAGGFTQLIQSGGFANYQWKLGPDLFLGHMVHVAPVWVQPFPSHAPYGPIKSDNGVPVHAYAATSAGTVVGVFDRLKNDKPLVTTVPKGQPATLPGGGRYQFNPGKMSLGYARQNAARTGH